MSDERPFERLYDVLEEKYGTDIDLSLIPRTHRTILCVVWVDGKIGNGGFGYLLEDVLTGDSDFVLTRLAYQDIKALRALKAIEMAFSIFPKSIPPASVDERLRIWNRKFRFRDLLYNRDLSNIKYFDTMEENMDLLDQYILANIETFRDDLGFKL